MLYSLRWTLLLFAAALFVLGWKTSDHTFSNASALFAILALATATVTRRMASQKSKIVSNA